VQTALEKNDDCDENNYQHKNTNEEANPEIKRRKIISRRAPLPQADKRWEAYISYPTGLSCVRC
jgi:hypothetical protein